jgi:hypothetical protein
MADRRRHAREDPERLHLFFNGLCLSGGLYSDEEIEEVSMKTESYSFTDTA